MIGLKERLISVAPAPWPIDGPPKFSNLVRLILKSLKMLMLTLSSKKNFIALQFAESYHFP